MFIVYCLGVMAIRGTTIPGEVYAWVAVFLLPINSAINPILYTISSIRRARVRTMHVSLQGSLIP